MYEFSSEGNMAGCTLQSNGEKDGRNGMQMMWCNLGAWHLLLRQTEPNLVTKVHAYYKTVVGK